MSTKASEIRVNDAMEDIQELFTDTMNGTVTLFESDQRSLRLILEVLAQRLLTDAAMLVGANYPQIHRADHGGLYTEPTRTALTNAVRDL